MNEWITEWRSHFCSKYRKSRIARKINNSSMRRWYDELMMMMMLCWWFYYVNQKNVRKVIGNNITNDITEWIHSFIHRELIIDEWHFSYCDGAFFAVQPNGMTTHYAPVLADESMANYSVHCHSGAVKRNSRRKIAAKGCRLLWKNHKLLESVSSPLQLQPQRTSSEWNWSIPRHDQRAPTSSSMNFNWWIAPAETKSCTKNELKII